VVVEQGVIDAQLLTGRDGTHGDQDRGAGEADVGSQEWLRNSIPGSYSASVSAARCKASEI